MTIIVMHAHRRGQVSARLEFEYSTVARPGEVRKVLAGILNRSIES